MIHPNRKTRRTLRLLGATSAAAMAFGLLPISPASAALADICPAEGQDDDRFTDDDTSVHEGSIDCAAAYELVVGKTATTYDPTGNLTRGQAATILVDYVELSTGTTLDTDDDDEFSDTADDVHAGSIDKAVDNGILVGRGGGLFGPADPITRGQFASLAVEATELALGRELDDDDTDDFDDDDDNVFEGNIEKAVDNDIVEGTAIPRRFSPNANISRGQTATIVVNAAGNVLQPSDRFAPVPVEIETFVVTPTDTAELTLADDDGSLIADASDDRRYSATGLNAGTVYRITLVDTASIRTSDDGLVTTFRSSPDPASISGFSVDVGADNADITSVNGLPPVFTGDAAAMMAARTTTATAIDGTITFTIDGTDPGSVTPVVYVNGGTGGDSMTGGTSPRLETSATSRLTFASAIESFGLGGRTVYSDAPVDPVDPVETFNVDPDDTATFTVADDTSPATAETSDDRTYTATGLTAGTIYRITLVNSASIAMSDDGVTFLSSADALSESGFSVDVGADNADITTVNGAPAVFADDAATLAARTTTIAAAADGTITFTIDGTDPGSVTPVVYVNGGTGGTSTTGGTSPRLETSATAAGTFASATESFGLGGPTIYIAAPVPVAGPTIDDVRATTDAGLVGNADAGDIHRFIFSEPLDATPATGATTGTYRVEDVDGTTDDIVCAGTGANAACSFQPAGTVDGTPQDDNEVFNAVLGSLGDPVAGGSEAGLQYPLTITNVSAQFVDTEGNQVDLDGSDTTIEVVADPVEPGALLVTSATANDDGSDGALSSGDEFVITFSRAVEGVATSTATLSINDADGSTGTISCAGGTGCSLNTAGTVLTIQNGGVPAGSNGTEGGFQGNITVSDTTGLNAVDGDQEPTVPFTIVLVPGGPVTPTGPTALGTVDDADDDGTLENGDEFVITFSEAINPDGVNSNVTSLAIRDADGSTGTVRCAADCVLTVGNTVLTIPNGGFPTGGDGTNPGFQGDVTVTDTTNLIAADDGAEVATPFTITATGGPVGP